MLISPAFAHGTGGGGSEVGPLILLAIAVVFILVYLGPEEMARPRGHAARQR